MQEVDRLRILRPGFLGNMLIGMVAAGLSWGLCGSTGARGGTTDRGRFAGASISDRAAVVGGL